MDFFLSVLPDLFVLLLFSVNLSKPGKAEEAELNGGFVQTDKEVEPQICRLPPHSPK